MGCGKSDSRRNKIFAAMPIVIPGNDRVGRTRRNVTSSPTNFGRSKKTWGPDTESGPEWFGQHQRLTWPRLSKRPLRSSTRPNWLSSASATANVRPRTTMPASHARTARADGSSQIPNARYRRREPQVQNEAPLSTLPAIAVPTDRKDCSRGMSRGHC